MLSTWQKIERVTGLLDGDLSEWERLFVESMRIKREQAVGQVVPLSEKQLASLDRLHDKHFAS